MRSFGDNQIMTEKQARFKKTVKVLFIEFHGTFTKKQIQTITEYILNLKMIIEHHI